MPICSITSLLKYVRVSPERDRCLRSWDSCGSIYHGSGMGHYRVVLFGLLHYACDFEGVVLGDEGVKLITGIGRQLEILKGFLDAGLCLGDIVRRMFSHEPAVRTLDILKEDREKSPLQDMPEVKVTVAISQVRVTACSRCLEPLAGCTNSEQWPSRASGRSTNAVRVMRWRRTSRCSERSARSSRGRTKAAGW